MSNNDIIHNFDAKTDKTLKILLEQTNCANDCIIIHLEGMVETFNSLFFQEQMNKILDDGYKNLVICADKLSYVSSTGIGNLIFLYRQIKIVSGNLILVNINNSVTEVLKLLGFVSVFTIKNSVEEAFAEINKNNLFSFYANVFPYSFNCPLCKSNLRAPHSGKYKCTTCKSTISISEE